MNERDEAIQRLREAVFNKGRRSKYHDAIEFRHRKEWPVLWKAIDRVLASSSDHVVTETRTEGESSER